MNETSILFNIGWPFVAVVLQRCEKLKLFDIELLPAYKSVSFFSLFSVCLLITEAFGI